MSLERNDRVFISSTCYDLVDLRAELRLFITSLGLTPIMSDYLDNDFETQANANSINTCLINLRTCDTVVIVLSQRYGGSLSEAGFGPISATHLEYREAKKEGKKILFFVRDRLLADFDSYKISNDVKLLRWVKPKDIGIFDFLEERKKLSNDPNDNWIWTFRDCLDVKERLRIDLKHKSNQIRLHKLVETGLAPVMVCHGRVYRISNSNQLGIHLEILNYGNSAALEPVVVFTNGTKTFQEAIARMDSAEKFPKIALLKPMKSMGEVQYAEFQEEYSEIDKQNLQSYSAHVLVSYKTIYGDHIIDATELKIKWNNQIGGGIIVANLIAKEFVKADTYEKLIRAER